MRGWVRLDPSRFEDNSRYSGFRSALYAHEESGRYVLAFAGTDPIEHGDHVNNINQALSLSSIQYTQAVSLAVDVKESLHDFTGTKLTLVGHSLGGGLASAAAIASASRAVTFNAAGLSGRQLTLGLHRGTVSWLEVSPGSSYVSAYYTSDDWLSKLQDFLPFMPGAIGRRLRIDSESLGLNPGHNIPGLIDALEEIRAYGQGLVCSVESWEVCVE